MGHLNQGNCTIQSPPRMFATYPSDHINQAQRGARTHLTVRIIQCGVLINETYMRLAGDGLGAQLTWQRLEEYSLHRHFGSCALKQPRAHKYSRQYRTNHFKTVSQTLHTLGWSMDTDHIRPPQTARSHKDKELITLLEVSHQDM